MYFLRTFAGLGIELDGTPVDSLNRKALILLAILAAEGPIGRDRLLALLWPESDAERARGSLKQTLHLIRRALNSGDVVLGVAELRLNPLRVESDVQAFVATAPSDPLTAAQYYAGPFLDAVHTSNSTEFERWLDQRREDLRLQYARVLEQLANEAEARSDFAGAISWWRKRQAVDPANGAVAARLMRALDAVGERAAALRQAELHFELLREEFDLPPDPQVVALLDELRSLPAREHEQLQRVAAATPALVRSPLAKSWRSTRVIAAAAVFAVLLLAGVVGALSVSNKPPRIVPPASVSDRTQAYEFLVQGRRLMQQKTVQGTADAMSYFKQATALDPTLTAAYVAIAEAEIAPGLTDPAPRFKRAKRALETALAVDSNLVAAHVQMTWVKMFYDRDYDAAQRHFRRAFQLDPTYGSLYNAYAVYLQLIGRPHESLTAMQRAYEMRPQATHNLVQLGNRYLFIGKIDVAQRYYQTALERDSSFYMGHWGMGRAYLQLRKYDEAVKEFKYPGSDVSGIHQEAYLGYALARAGQHAEARRILAILRERIRAGGYVPATEIAIIHIGLGEHEAALDWLERMVNQRGLRIFLKVDPLFDPLRTDARFQRLLVSLGF